MKRTFHITVAAGLLLGACFLTASAAWYGRDIVRQENGNYVLYEPYPKQIY